MTWFDIVKRKKHPALKRAGVGGFSKPKRTPKHPKKSHVVVVKDGKKTKTIRFGEQGASVAGKPKKGESKRMKAKRKSFKSRHRKNIKRGKTSAAYWANDKYQNDFCISDDIIGYILRCLNKEKM